MVVVIGPCGRLLTPFKRTHTFYTPDNWTNAVLSKLFLRSAVIFNNLFWVLGISKVGLLWEKYISYFQRWTWVAGACARGPRAAGLGSPSQVRGTHRLRRRGKDTAKHFTLTHVLLTCLGIESQQSFPMSQQMLDNFKIQKWILHLQLPFFRQKEISIRGLRQLPVTLKQTQVMWDLLCKCRCGDWCVDCVSKCTQVCQDPCTHETGLLCAWALDYTQHSGMFHTQGQNTQM